MAPEQASADATIVSFISTRRMTGPPPTEPAMLPDPRATLVNEPAHSTTLATRSCLNCAAAIAGDFCASCGQSTRTTRITFPKLLRTLTDQILSVDSTLIATFRALIRRPGPFVRSFLLGRRVGFARPLPYYLFVVGLNVAASAILRSATSAKNPAGPVGSFWKENFVALQIGLALAALMLPVAAARRILHEDAGFSVAEHFVSLLYVLAQSVLVILIVRLALLPFGVSFNGDAEGLTWLTAFVGYTLWGSRGFLFEPLWKVALKLLVAFVLALITLGVVGLALQGVGAI